jgi:OmpA-OmpF porin, OOP family
MKILILGFLSLLGWTAFSTHIWVCNVKGLCSEQIPNSVYENTAEEISQKDSSSVIKIISPGDLMIYFEFDKSDFMSDSLTDRYFTDSKTFLDNNSRALLNITGYTDSIGSDLYNQALGYRRAQTMENYFSKNGLQKEKIVIESRGEKDPAASNSTINGRANNRRTIVTIKN